MKRMSLISNMSNDVIFTKCLDSVLAERNRMAREIHDTLAQNINAVLLHLGAAEQALSQNLPTKAATYINRAYALARDGLRQTQRSIGGLRSEALEKKDLCEALNESLLEMAKGTTLRVKFTCSSGQLELPLEWQQNLLRLCQEALANAIRHARAGEFRAQLVFDTKEIRLALRDDGCGFDPAKRSDGFGLQGMRERVEMMRGHFSLHSAKGIGTLISIFVPLANLRLLF
jgi:signal transduction histidine kinase